MSVRVEIFDGTGRERKARPIWTKLCAAIPEGGDWPAIDNILSRYNGRTIHHADYFPLGYITHVEFGTDEEAVRFMLEWS